MIKINENIEHKLQDVLNKAMHLQREDYAAPTDVVSVNEPCRLTVGEQTFSMTEHAEKQLCERWPGMSTLSRHLEEKGDGDLQRQTLNELLQRDERKIVVRTIQPNGERLARAVVSDMYRPIDDDLIIPKVVETAAQYGDKWRALGGQITDTNSYLKFISREPQVTLNLAGRKRELYIGFMYQNSEVGRGYMQFKAFFFDSFCDNGCTFGDVTVANCKFVHRGSRISTEFGQILEKRIEDVELSSIKAAVADATRLTCQAGHVEKVKNLLEASFTRELPAGKEAPFIREVSKRIGLSEYATEQALVHYDGTANQYGVQAAITASAPHAATYAVRQTLQEAGGKVLSMNNKIWESITALV